MSLPQTTDILIVGAGPAGLACALSLLHEGYSDITIIDNHTVRDVSSRATVIHAATLEALDKLGCAEPFIQEGRKAKAVGFWSAGRFVRMVSFDLLAPYTKFPMILVIPQATSEQILEDTLRDRGVTILRPYTVVDLKPNEQDTRITDVHFDNGEVIQARCVVGADGSRSLIRNKVGVNFMEPDGEVVDGTPNAFNSMIIADVTFTTPLTLPDPDLGVLLILSGDNLFLLSPLPTKSDDPRDRVYRIGVGIPPSLGNPPSSPSREYLQSLVDIWGPARIVTPSSSTGPTPSVTLGDIAWTSRFRTHSAIADTFFTHVPVAGSDALGGVVCLIGDAAHIHPPVGGQGMNLGIRDAIALGRVLPGYMKRVQGMTASSDSKTIFAAEEPLRAWAVARRARGLAVIHMVKQMLRGLSRRDEWTWIMGVVPVNFYWLRNVVSAFVSLFPWVRKMAAWRVSGLASSD